MSDVFWRNYFGGIMKVFWKKFSQSHEKLAVERAKTGV